MAPKFGFVFLMCVVVFVLYNDISHYADLHGPTGARLSKWWDASSK